LMKRILSRFLKANGSSDKIATFPAIRPVRKANPTLFTLLQQLPSELLQ
jgi:hypothetical protein